MTSSHLTRTQSPAGYRRRRRKGEPPQINPPIARRLLLPISQLLELCPYVLRLVGNLLTAALMPLSMATKVSSTHLLLLL